MESATLSQIGLAGLAVMGQNLALNIAEKGFPISVYNRTNSKVDETLDRAHREGQLPLVGHYTPKDFVLSIKKPRSIIILVKAGAPVDQTITALSAHMEAGDTIIDGGNEWYENTERRMVDASAKGLLYLGMGVSGGEDGARNGPSLMPGGSHRAYLNIHNILEKVAAQVDDGPCVTYIGEGGSGNFVKMVHNGIEYGDMQLISEAYDVLKNVGGLGNEELAEIFGEWNRGELESFLIEITSDIFKVEDQESGYGHLVDKILDKTGMKGTGKWTVQQAAELSIAAPTIAASLDSRYMSGLKEEREAAAEIFKKEGLKEEINNVASLDKKRLVDDVRQALYASKICSYAQGKPQICNHLTSVFSTPTSTPPPLTILVEEISAASRRGGKIFVYGVGREGLMLKALCMRLFHLGLSAHCIFDMTTPPIASPDLLISSAGPGGFSTVDAICGVARSGGARVVLLTAQPEAGSSVKYASVVAHIPAQTMADDRVGGSESGRALLPMGSVYEGAMFVLFEMVVYKLGEVLGRSPEEIRSRHTNLE